MSATAMKEVHAMFARAVDCHQGGQSAQAEALYRQVIDALPDCAAALNNLGLLVPRDEALALLHRAVAAEPDYVDALLNLSGALHGGNDLRGADLFYQRALALIPETGDDLFRLARVLQLQGRDEEAVAQYERAVAVNPAMTGALCNLAALHGAANRRGQAMECLRRALSSDPASNILNYNMAIVLKQQGRLTEAAACIAHIPHPQPLAVQAAAKPRRVVLMAAASAGNVPTDWLLPKHSNTLINWQVEYATDEQEQDLPAYDVAFNAVGNADMIDEALPRLQRFHSRRSLLNNPAAVAKTRRDRLPDLLAGLPGVLVPRVLRVERAVTASPALPSRLAAAGIDFPVLVQPIVGHGGEAMRLVHSQEEMAALGLHEADANYVIAYHDYRSQDGFYRKYRAVFVDGVPYPYHLAICNQSLGHYVPVDMLAAAWKREEEARFLQDPAGALGATAWAGVAEIGRRLKLDYAGVDFSTLPDGRVLVFKANATMSVHLNDSEADFPYKHACVPAIFQAFDAMLDRHAKAADLQS